MFYAGFGKPIGYGFGKPFGKPIGFGKPYAGFGYPATYGAGFTGAVPVTSVATSPYPFI